MPLPCVVSVAAGVSVGAVEVALPSVGAAGWELGVDWSVGCCAGGVVGVTCLVGFVGLVGFDAFDAPFSWDDA